MDGDTWHRRCSLGKASPESASRQTCSLWINNTLQLLSGPKGTKEHNLYHIVYLEIHITSSTIWLVKKWQQKYHLSQQHQEVTVSKNVFVNYNYSTFVNEEEWWLLPFMLVCIFYFFQSNDLIFCFVTDV